MCTAAVASPRNWCNICFVEVDRAREAQGGVLQCPGLARKDVLWEPCNPKASIRRYGVGSASRQRVRGATMTDRDFRAQLAGYSLTTAEILYRLPDHPSLLQSFIWQEYDVHPRFPRLVTFLDFWRRNLEGPLYRVTVAHKKLITPAELRLVGGEYRMH
jgi:uncharacterized protein Usg